MSPLILIGLLVLNVVISFWNARVVGLIWPERNQSGTFMRLVIWGAVIQSVVGFSMPLLLGEVYIAHLLGLMSAKAMAGVFSLWYLLIIIPILGSGFIITIHSWIVAWRERNFLDMALAGYNTIAMAHNLYGATSGISKAFDGVSALAEDEEAGIGMLCLGLVVLSLVGGALITRGIIFHYAGKLPLPARQEATV